MSSNFTLKQSLTLETGKAKKTKVALHIYHATIHKGTQPIKGKSEGNTRTKQCRDSINCLRQMQVAQESDQLAP